MASARGLIESGEGFGRVLLWLIDMGFERAGMSKTLPITGVTFPRRMGQPFQASCRSQRHSPHDGPLIRLPPQRRIRHAKLRPAPFIAVQAQ
jgi:hypothetical protein